MPPEARLAAIWRHPIKAVGAEPLQSVALMPGATMPGDRVWAVAHAASRAEDGRWSGCGQFLRGATAPELMAVTAETGRDGRIRLTHPRRPELLVDPDAQAGRLIEWLVPLIPPGRPGPARVVRAGRGMTDSPEPTVSILSRASLRALEQHAGLRLSERRFRGNLWLDGLAPWQERDWIGQEIAIGGVRFRILGHIRRCAATGTDPDSGRRDIDLPALMRERLGHDAFGVEAEVLSAGRLRPGDRVTR